MESSLTIKQLIPANPATPKKGYYDRDDKEPEPSYKTLYVKFEGDSEIYSKVLRKLEEMANGHGWILT